MQEVQMVVQSSQEIKAPVGSNDKQIEKHATNVNQHDIGI
jgi:hypothetical protein